MLEINPSFGSCGYWHEIEGAPDGDPSSAATMLFELVQRHKALPGNRWPIDQCVVRAMAVELAVKMASDGNPLSEDLVWLLAWSAEVPSLALVDPPAFMAGGWRGGSPPASPSAKVTASWIDREHFLREGSMMPISALQRALEDRLDGSSAARSTLRRWRAEPEYVEWISFPEQADVPGGDT